MKIIMVLYIIFLFVLLTPSILFKIPKKGNKWTVAFIHGFIFAVIFQLTHKLVKKISHKEHLSLYTDENCNIPFATPKKRLPRGVKRGVYYHNPDRHRCVGPATFGDHLDASGNLISKI